ncbi:hypothetical protein HDU97_000325 [Phlyctochytrium planicorne]|nr:hypothetical protein HDU97_000325 [Phlyctochytrium planicorne]
MSLNAAQLGPGREPMLIAGERSVFVQDGVMMDYVTGNGYPGQGHHYYSPKGKLHLTSRRIIYIPPAPQHYFDTLTIPLPNLQEGKLIQPWFGANKYEAVCLPVPNGGLPLAGTVSWTFKEGGAFEFSTMFKSISERVEVNAYQPDEGDFLPEYVAPPTSAPPPSDTFYPPPPGDPPSTNASPPVFQGFPVSTVETVPSLMDQGVGEGGALVAPLQPFQVQEGSGTGVAVVTPSAGAAGGQTGAGGATATTATTATTTTTYV